MGSPSTGQFVHRANWDGTFDSICRECVATVATAACESELEEAERDHVCSPWMRQRFTGIYRTSSN
jgi:hypothetical protein